MSTTQNNHEAILSELAKMAGKTISQDNPIVEFPKSNPLTVKAAEQRVGRPEDMTDEKLVETVTEYIADQKQMTVIHQNFDARFEEVMVAAHRVFRSVFGTAGKGKRIESFFGSNPPQTANFVVGLGDNGEKIYESAVAVSPFTFAPLGSGATVIPGHWRHPQFGILGKLSFEVRKKNAPAVEGLVKLIQNEIDTNSIYKGHVLDLSRSADSGEYDLSHKHVKTDSHLVYNADVAMDLKMELWGKLEHSKVLAAQGVKPVLRVCMEGDYGCGKTETALITARKAVQFGYTTLIVKPGVNDRITDLVKAFRIAEMYAPSILIIEDLDKLFTSANYSAQDESTITNLLDGADSKTHEVNVLWTTNNIQDIPKGMMRPGRTDTTITFGPLDREPVEEMYNAILGKQLRDDVDFDRVYEEVKDLGPSFIRGTFDKARTYSIITNNGVPGQPLSTEDLIQAARVMKKQHGRFDDAKKTENKKITVDDLLRSYAQEASVNVAKVTTYTNDNVGDIEPYVNEQMLVD